MLRITPSSQDFREKRAKEKRMQKNCVPKTIVMSKTNLSKTKIFPHSKKSIVC